MRHIRILMVHDHNLFREGLCRLLENTPGLRVVGQCENLTEAISALSEIATDVA
jgi:DNA-binding NarL/FixJ family response regulator